MPRAPEAEIVLVPLEDVARRLCISRRTFERRWQDAFTVRTKGGNAPGHGRPRMFLSDEVEIAVREGRDALLLFRMTRKRLGVAA